MHTSIFVFLQVFSVCTSVIPPPKNTATENKINRWTWSAWGTYFRWCIIAVFFWVWDNLCSLYLLSMYFSFRCKQSFIIICMIWRYDQKQDTIYDYSNNEWWQLWRQQWCWWQLWCCRACSRAVYLSSFNSRDWCYSSLSSLFLLDSQTVGADCQWCSNRSCIG